MRARGLLLAALAAVAVALSAPLAGAQGGTTITIEGHDSGTEFWFQLEGSSERNPPIPVDPGATVTVRFVNRGSILHNVVIDPPVDEGVPCCPPAGGTGEFTFTAPQTDATITYFCTPHRGAGMLGDLVVGAGAATGGGGPALPDLGGFAPGSRGFGLALAVAIGGAVFAMFARGMRSRD